MTIRNARLKVWINSSEVTITLQPGQTISHSNSEDTDEGYAWSSTTWTYDADDGVVTKKWGYGGRDCDGGIEAHGVDYCPVDKLKTATTNEYIGPYGYESGSWNDDHWVEVPGWPDWQEDEPASHYDQYARLSNY
jgi:hypothetical protein